MRLSVTQKWVFAAFAVCVALLVCIREDVFLPKSETVVIVDRGAVGEAYPDKIQVVILPKEEPKKTVSEVPAKTEEAKQSQPVVEAPKPQPAPVVRAPGPPPAPIVKMPRPLPPVIKAPEQQPSPVVKPQEPQPPPVVEAPVPPPAPVVIEAPKPPSVPVVIETPPPAPVEEAAPVESRGPHTYFVNREVESNNIRMFPRWTGMLARTSAEAHTLDNVCGPPPRTPCKLKEWKDFLEDLQGEPLLEKLKEVNRYLNKYPYIDDIVNWGFDNYWETPYEFQRKSGNCKDYAIAKFMSLRAIGVPNDIMRIVVLKDLNLGGVIHAVLVVSVDEKSYILDNQIKQVVSTDKVYHYLPIYSINEEHWWQHFMID